MTDYVIDADNDTPVAEVGGKGHNLLQLRRAQLPVPAFICLTASAFTAGTASVAAEIEALFAQLWTTPVAELSRLAEALQQRVLEAPWSPAIDAQLAALCSTGKRYSVRSSGVCEDGRRHSFAGQFLTRLNVPPDQLPEAIKACWASAFDVGVLAYIKRKGLRDYRYPMAVVIQEMVAAESAGVLFQADPQGDLDRLLVVAGFGLGEGVVADRVETDTYVYQRRSQSWELQVGIKTHGLVSDAHGGVKSVALAPELGRQAVLSDEQRRQLLDLSAKVSAVFPQPQDIEWAFDAAGQLYLLQARAITTLAAGPERVFDNSNIAESYPGVISPMTFSILRQDYYHSLRELLRLLGVPAAVRARQEERLQQLAGYIGGRAYYNMGSWYQLILLAPYFKPRLVRYFEQMIGTDGATRTGEQGQRLRRWELWRLRMAFPLKCAWNLFRHDALMRRYFGAADRLYQATSTAAREVDSADRLIGVLQNHVRQFMPLLSLPILNDFFAMIFMALTRAQLDRRRAEAGTTDADRNEALLSQLLANQNLASAAPVASLAAMASAVRGDPRLRDALADILENGDPQRVEQSLIEQDCATFATQWHNHLRDFGHRSPRELIMEADTFHDDPRQLLSLILQTAAQPERPPAAAPDHAELDAELNRRRHPRLLRWLLNKTRATIAHREATRLDRGRHFALLRRLLRDLGQRLVEAHVLQRWDDVFYLTLPELEQYRHGTSPDPDLGVLVRARREAAATWRAHDPGSQLVTRGLASAAALSPVATARASDGPLSGNGVSGGEVTATARVVRDPRAAGDISGAILVTETTDPGWVFLMTLAAGLICERGSLLSHTAIIGRELGIPTIVGVKQATRQIQDGQTITMNGDTGAITLGTCRASKRGPDHAH